MYYRFFNDFITIPVIMQAKTNGGQLGDSAFSLMRPTDAFYFIDTIILIILAIKVNKPAETSSKKSFRIIFASSILVFLINLAVAESDRPELLTADPQKTKREKTAEYKKQNAGPYKAPLVEWSMTSFCRKNQGED